MLALSFSVSLTLAAEPQPPPTVATASKPLLAWADIPAARLAAWRELALSGKGVAVVKLRQGECGQVMLSHVTNFAFPASSVRTEPALRFASAEDLAAFLRAVGAGVGLSDGSWQLVDDTGIVERFTPEEKRLLRLDDPLGYDGEPEPLRSDATSEVTAPEFAWVHRGTLQWGRSCGFQYRTTAGRLALVSGDPVMVAAAIRAELSDEQLLDALVREQLPAIFLRLLADQDAVIITRAYFDRWSAATQTRGGDPAAAAAASELLARHMAAGTLVTSDRHRWSLSMPVLRTDCSIERWDAEGRVSHFEIVTLRKVVVAPGGSVPFVQVRTQEP